MPSILFQEDPWAAELSPLPSGHPAPGRTWVVAIKSERSVKPYEHAVSLLKPGDRLIVLHFYKKVKAVDSIGRVVELNC